MRVVCLDDLGTEQPWTVEAAHYSAHSLLSSLCFAGGAVCTKCGTPLDDTFSGRIEAVRSSVGTTGVGFQLYCQPCYAEKYGYVAELGTVVLGR